MRRTCRHHHRGFTLLELVLVMVVACIAMAIVAPSLSGAAKGRRAGDTAAQIVSLAEYARTQAVTEGRDYRLNFDVNAGEFWLTAQDDTGQFADLGKEFGRQFGIPDGVRIDLDLRQPPTSTALMQVPQQQQQPAGDGTYVTFRATGRTDPGTIRLVGPDGVPVTVICESATELYHVATGNGR